MLPDRVSNPGPLTYESGALPIALRGPASRRQQLCKIILKSMQNVEVMDQTSSIYDHFIIWPSSVTFTFNLPEQMFLMVFLLTKGNNYAKLF